MRRRAARTSSIPTRSGSSSSRPTSWPPSRRSSTSTPRMTASARWARSSLADGPARHGRRASEFLDLRVHFLLRTVTGMTMRLKGKTALITGSTSNIGRAAAVGFAAEGAHVIVSGRDDARGAAVLAEIRAAGGVADYVHADLDGTAAASRGLADAATELLGGHLDILVNNAGIFPPGDTLTVD